MTEQEALEKIKEKLNVYDIQLFPEELEILNNALNELQIYRETIKNIDIKKLNEVENG